MIAMVHKPLRYLVIQGIVMPERSQFIRTQKPSISVPLNQWLSNLDEYLNNWGLDQVAQLVGVLS